MPFVSEKQRKKCYSLYQQALQLGIQPRWDCYEWEKETKKRNVKKKRKKKN